jgi:voltage-gated potassium channel
MRSRLARSALFLLGIFAGGTVGYRVIEHAPWWDCFYMTAITLTTVGYREVFPLSWAGEAFTVVLLLAGLGAILTVATHIGRTVLEGELQEILGKARRSRMIGNLSGHQIVCGCGRVGLAVAQELKAAGKGVVVIEMSTDKAHEVRELGFPVVIGDATNEATLKAAGIERAHGLVACLNDDARNVYTVLTARSMSPDLVIVARASEDGADRRLLRAGATRVVNPYLHGGVRLAHILLKPNVVDFLDVSLTSGTLGLELEQLHIGAGNILAGRTLAEADLRRRCGVGVVAVWRNGTLHPNPEAAFPLAEGDVLVVLGTRESLESFEDIICAVNPT